MLGKLQLELETENKEFMAYQKAVILQSILMFNINLEYAKCMHESGLHPYSQAVINQNGKNIWSICTTNEEAYHQILEPLYQEGFSEFFIEAEKWKVNIKKKNMMQMARSELMEKYYFEDAARYIEIAFLTPTAFKSQGEYIYTPKMQLIYQSLMNKYEASSSKETVKSEEVLEQLIQGSKIVNYNLWSCYYTINKVKIPTFMGKIRIKINGPQGMVNFANLLFRFGEFSGIGIKTAMGMGKISIIERVKV